VHLKISPVSEFGSVRELMDAVARGEVSPEVAEKQLAIAKQYESVGDFAKIDHARTERTGFPEVIWGQDKTADQIVAIMQVMESKSATVMATRVDAQKAAAIRERLPQVTYFELARICAIAPDYSARSAKPYDSAHPGA